ncbi:MAG: hypothetical protein L0H63_13295 [Nitrococcus sp.]|nr:hypothetical protein [Nitrococcus sp.]
MSTHDKKDRQNQEFDPRPVSDEQLRAEYSREQVERWRKQADDAHCDWFDVMDNQYGKD